MSGAPVIAAVGGLTLLVALAGTAQQPAVSTTDPTPGTPASGWVVDGTGYSRSADRHVAYCVPAADFNPDGPSRPGGTWKEVLIPAELDYTLIDGAACPPGRESVYPADMDGAR